MRADDTYRPELMPVPTVNGDLRPILDSVESLRNAWRDVVRANTAAFHEARRRSLRRHAIETGIIERLYEVDWGVTEALVAEGITADTLARADGGTVTEDVLATIQAQYDALAFLADAAREGRDLSISLIKQLHVALTQRQRTYAAQGSNGIDVMATLHHGEWKKQANRVVRPDGSVLTYTLPEQVAPQMERLVALYVEAESADPIVRAAWLHHGFVRIHPFEDGNGRVARGLTLLSLLRADLAPLVVDRRERERYLRALDAANDGDLRPLIRFFAQLEIVALRSELEQPVAPSEGGALRVLDAGIDRLRVRGEPATRQRAQAAAALATQVHKHVTSWLEDMAAKIEDRLGDIDPQARATVQAAGPSEPAAHYWRRQIIAAARSVDFFVNLAQGTWWARLRVAALGQELRYLVFVQKVGRGDTGVIALTVYAEDAAALVAGTHAERAQETADAERLVVSTPTESVTWTYTDPADSRRDEVDELLDTTLAAALHKFTASLG